MGCYYLEGMAFTLSGGDSGEAEVNTAVFKMQIRCWKQKDLLRA